MQCFKTDMWFPCMITEASKVIMQYVAEVSGKGQEIDRVKEQLLQSNPVLEGKNLSNLPICSQNVRITVYIWKCV